MLRNILAPFVVTLTLVAPMLPFLFAMDNDPAFTQRAPPIDPPSGDPAETPSTDDTGGDDGAEDPGDPYSHPSNKTADQDEGR